MSNTMTSVPEVKQCGVAEFPPLDEDRRKSGEIRLSAIKNVTSRFQGYRSFQCPLCVEAFKKFSHLERHLLFMHPLRPKIMKLVKERYGIPVSKSDEGMEQSRNFKLECRCHCRPSKALPPVTRSSQTANSFQSGWKEMSSKAFHFPPKLRHKSFVYDYLSPRREESRMKTKL